MIDTPKDPPGPAGSVIGNLAEAAPVDSLPVPQVGRPDGAGGVDDYQGDAVDDLAALLDSAGARCSFDRGRSNTHPCTFCGKPPPAGFTYALLTIGRYISGDDLTRPVCAGCVEIAALRMTKPRDATPEPEPVAEPPAPYEPKPGERVRVTELYPYDAFPPLLPGAVVTAWYGTQAHTTGPRAGWVSLWPKGKREHVWCRVEPANEPATETP